MKIATCLLVGLCAALSPSAVSASQIKYVHTLLVSTYNPTEHSESYPLAEDAEEIVTLPATSIWRCKTEANSYNENGVMSHKHVVCNLKSNNAIEVSSAVVCGGAFKKNLGMLQLRDTNNSVTVLWMQCAVK